MRLSWITESDIYKVIAGATTKEKYPEEFPHKIVAAPAQLFHGTSSLSIKGIKTSGLDIGQHLTNNRKLGVYSAHRAVARFGGDPVVVVFDTTGLEDLSLGGTLVDLQILKPVPPNAMIRIYNVRSNAGKERAGGCATHIGPRPYHDT